MMDISIIIVSRNVIDLLIPCLESVFREIRGLRAEVIVVDNASEDGTAERISTLYPQVKLVVNQKNVGFPKANNQAIGISSGRYIFLLNPDTILRPGCVTKMVSYIEDHPDVGLLGPKILTKDGSIQYDCARNFPDLWGCFTEISFLRRIFPKSRLFGHQYMTYWDHEESRPVPCLVGAAMLVRRTAAEQIGCFLDETIPMYLEDVDFCYRIYQRGWTVFYLSEAVIEHWGGASTDRSVDRISYELLKWEAYRIFLERYDSKISSWILRCMVLIFAPLRMLVISLGICMLPILPRRIRPFFSRFTLAKAVALIGWSLNISYYKWSE